MKRINPLGSLVGLGLTVLLFIGLGFSLLYHRGLAFSPGDLTAKTQNGVVLQGYSSHADFEKHCSSCHEPLIATLAQKCENCHVDIAQQSLVGEGVHSNIANQDQCATCHPEHRGRNFDPTTASFSLFDHSNTTFSLNWHQTNYDTTPMGCNECHKNPDFSQVDDQTCQNCHSSNDGNFIDMHVSNFGSDCLGCHDGVDRMQGFSHASTGYALDGAHAQLECSACHATSELKNTPLSCVDCHTEPSIHQGLFAESCDTCHTPQAWTNTQLNGRPFDHFGDTGFSLVLHQVDYSNQSLTCITCHPNNLETLELQICIDCHMQHDQVFVFDHQQQFGTRCLDCHDGIDRLSNFDHANFFLLDGKHADLKCEDCHTGQDYRGTPSQCSQCHAEPDIHAGIFGQQCADCHTTQAWSPASLLSHDFPVNHGLEEANTQLECTVCHTTNYIDYTCYNCHEHQPVEITESHLEAGIAEQDLPACANCHLQGTVVEGGSH